MSREYGQRGRRVGVAAALAMAVRTALAAVAAWVAVLPLSGVADEYRYYAPFGAVVVVTSGAMTSMRASLHTGFALAVGAALGVAAHWVPGPGYLSLGVAVGIGALVGQPRWFGAMTGWVPISALFVLILGSGGQDLRFVLGYLGLTTFGALVGAVVVVAFPPLLLARTEQAQQALRDALGSQIAALAAALTEGSPSPSHEDREMAERRSQRARELVSQATDGPPVNWRLWHWRGRAARLRDQGRALTSLAFLVDHLADVLTADDVRPPEPVPEAVRGPAAAALRATADLMGDIDGSTVPEETWSAAWRAMEELAGAIVRLHAETGEDPFAVGALVDGIRRALRSVAPRQE